jgi:thiol-disulfide isomerase/thioredoxin
VGDLAPEISGEDLDGKVFKLSDYRGKVVMLDFWALWCAPCRGMYPHNRRLVSRLSDKPFALLGIDAGDPAFKLREVCDNGDITWRFWLDKAPGPITKEWQIEAFPTIFILDKQGIIRYKTVGVPPDSDVESVIEDLLGKSEREKAS